MWLRLLNKVSPSSTHLHNTLLNGLIPKLLKENMSRICEICEKSYMRGNQVPRGIGRRVLRRTTKRQTPNLRYKKFTLNGNSVRLRICTSCLKRLRMGQGNNALVLTN